MDPDRDDVARLRKGDPAGLSGLMSRHQDRLFRYLLRLVGDEAVGEDMFQQTWLKVAERVGHYDSSRPFGPWLFAVARNLALDHLRRRQPESLEDVDEPAVPDPDPLAHAVARQQGVRLAETVAGLAPLDREVLSLRFEEDLELPQLAVTLGVPVPTAKARLYRALARLRGRLLARGPAEEWR
ncbi:MAG TPA: sigma-70 family RNA polymerase sigma factor [Vicinamibacteria bacterium]